MRCPLAVTIHIIDQEKKWNPKWGDYDEFVAQSRQKYLGADFIDDSTVAPATPPEEHADEAAEAAERPGPYNKGKSKGKGKGKGKKDPGAYCTQTRMVTVDPQSNKTM